MVSGYEERSCCPDSPTTLLFNHRGREAATGDSTMADTSENVNNVHTIAPGTVEAAVEFLRAKSFSGELPQSLAKAYRTAIVALGKARLEEEMENDLDWFRDNLPSLRDRLANRHTDKKTDTFETYRRRAAKGIYTYTEYMSGNKEVLKNVAERSAKKSKPAPTSKPTSTAKPKTAEVEHGVIECCGVRYTPPTEKLTAEDLQRIVMHLASSYGDESAMGLVTQMIKLGSE